MSDYYNSYGGSSRRDVPQPKSGVMVLVDFLCAIISIVVVGAMTLTLLVPYISPNTMWILSIMGLVAPAVFLITVILWLYWIIRWRVKWMLIFTTLCFCSSFSLSLFYKPQIRKVYESPSYSRAAIKIMSYNVRQFFNDEGGSSVDSVFNYVKRINPDIICFQEFNSRLVDDNSDFGRMVDSYHTTYGVPNADISSNYPASLVIYSKYKIVDSGLTCVADSLTGGMNGSIWADLLVRGDTLRVFNNHLHSTAINARDDDYLSNKRFLEDTLRKAKLADIADRFRDNSIRRAIQTDSIASVVKATKYAKIVCGDFNDTPMSYIYRAMSHGLNDAFSEVGEGYSHTYRGFRDLLRIDYVLASEQFEHLSYEVGDVEFSDHLPVIVRLKYNN